SARSGRTSRSSRRRRSTPTAARARSASTRVRPERSTRWERSTRPAVSRTGRRRRRRFPRSTARSSAHRCTAATSVRTSARGTAASRSAVQARSRLRARRRTSRSSNGSNAMATTCARRMRDCTCRRTTAGTCAETRWSRWGTRERGTTCTCSTASARTATTCCASTPSGRQRRSRLMAAELQRTSADHDAGRWLAWIRIGAIPFAVFQVAVTTGYPGGCDTLAWITTGAFGLGALIFCAFTRMRMPGPRLALAGLAFDTLVVAAFVLIYNFEQGTPIRQLLYLPIAEAALLYGIAGAVTLAILTAPILAVFEWLREHRVAPRSYHVDFVTFQIGTSVLMALLIGWLVLRFRAERALAFARADEAEELRDRLGRRVDLLEAANRAARALRSSLVL